MHYPKAVKIRNLALLSALMFLAALSAGCGQRQDRGDKEATVDSVIFTRTGLFLKMADNVPIREINIYRDGQRLVSRYPGSAEDLVDLEWTGGNRYDLEVLTDGSSITMPIYAPDKPSPVKLGEIILEDLDKGEMEYRYYASRGSSVCISDDGRYVAVGSKGGYVYLIGVESRDIVWRHKIPEGRVTTVVFTDDGKLMAGEESRDGYLYCFDIKSGDILWQYKTLDDFSGENAEITMVEGTYKNYPVQLWGLCMDKDNNPYLTARFTYKKEINGKKISVTRSFIYRFDMETGRPTWKFPVNSSTWGLTISNDDKYIIPSVGWSKEAVLYVIDASSGRSLWQHSFTVSEENPDESFMGTTGFQARISPDNRYVVVNQVYPDNTFVFDNLLSVERGQAGLLWKKKFLEILDVSGTSISVSTVNLELTDRDLIFATWSSRALGSLTGNNSLPTQHPAADTLFVYDYEGALKWKWKLGDGVWNNECLISEDNRYMVIPIGLVPENSFANPEDMGIYVFSPDIEGGATDRLNWFYHTEGFAYKAAVSRDGKYIAVLEGPFDIDPDTEREDIAGKHRLIILS